VIDVQALRWGPASGMESSLDACELVLLDGGSVLFSAATDWTLEIEPGRWPDLPAWCWPPENWFFRRMDLAVDLAQMGPIMGVRETLDEVGGHVGLRIMFDECELVVGSGADIVVELHLRSEVDLDGFCSGFD
jgi:hypothetical protein